MQTPAPGIRSVFAELNRIDAGGVTFAMECILLIGLQGSGKSAYFKAEFADTHVRINRDMLKTRTREARLFHLCLDFEQRCVIDNTNSTVEERARFIGPAKARGFRIVGYYFDVRASDALKRNQARPENCRVPAVAIFATAKRMQLPHIAEGFDALFRVKLRAEGYVVSQTAGA